MARKIVLEFRSKFVNPPAPKYHTKGCSRSSVDSPGVRTLVFVASEPFLGADVRVSIAGTPFCAILWCSPSEVQGVGAAEGL